MSSVNQQDYLKLKLVTSEGRVAGAMFVHHEKVGEKVVEWMTQQALGEVLVSNDKTDWGNTPIYP